MSPTTQAPPSQQADATRKLACHTILADLTGRHQGIEHAVMAGLDGRFFACDSDLTGEGLPVQVAAMSSSLLALTESFSREVLRSVASYNSISTAHGTIVVVRVPSSANRHVLCVWADKSETVAMTLRHALDTAQQLADELDSEA